MKRVRLGIKAKLYLTYITGLVITLILMMAVGYILHGAKVFPPSGERDTDSENMMAYAFQFRSLNSVEEASRSINQAANNLRKAGVLDFMLDEAFWDEADKSFKHQVSLVVFKNNEPLYISKKLPTDIDLSRFPAYGEMDGYPNKYLFENFEMTIQRQVDYISDSGDLISAFILLGVGDQPARFFVIILNNILMFMGLSMLVMGFISWFVVRSITVPLDSLIEASNEVRRGNLEYKVEPTSNDKIGELSQAFEAMRLQLLQNKINGQQYEENRRQMIASISHDLRTPITAIKLHAEGIMDGVAGSPEKMSKYLKSMSNNARVVDRLLKELTLFSNLDSEQEAFQFSEVPIIRFMEDLKDEWLYDYAERRTVFRLEHECEQTSKVRLDVIHFRRVMVNIVENSVKYVDKTPLYINISTACLGDKYRISIQDNGEGVPEDQLDQIFDRFHRVDEARQSHTPGSGLGLAIARQIVLKHGGEIWAENSVEGGLRICIEMPVLKEDADEKNSNN